MYAISTLSFNIQCNNSREIFSMQGRWERQITHLTVNQTKFSPVFLPPKPKICVQVSLYCACLCRPELQVPEYHTAFQHLHILRRLRQAVQQVFQDSGATDTLHTRFIGFQLALFCLETFIFSYHDRLIKNKPICRLGYFFN